MSISVTKMEPPVREVGFTKYALKTVLADGREVSVPLEWVPRLREAADRQRRDWRLIAGGVGIHWNQLDEDVMVEDLLAFGSPPPALTRGAARARRTARRPARRASSRR